ncbi:hypothetical protein PROFUN_00866 [Planoprotostelium fungivorum]|uniref:Indoleamine 2,3-dioxygenase n=1 Tax=Planoprotostelium fungivorum TaxID=1890364 RepID=A0A2P6P069_9EUKA|nr:hypothetical protein PROFUN_00866 [Planoprotostelium fungivorum]
MLSRIFHFVNHSVLALLPTAGFSYQLAAKKLEAGPTLRALQKMVDDLGDGQWPPVADHSGWPEVHMPYHDLAMRTGPRLTVTPDQVSTDDVVNAERIGSFRKWMEEELTCIEMDGVEEAISQMQLRQKYAMAACLGFLRHAYRWGTVPIVKLAQDEEHVDFPDAIEGPYTLIREYLTLHCESGCMYTLFYCNMDPKTEQLVYSTTRNQMKEIQETERWNVLLLYKIEQLAIDRVYTNLARACDAATKGDIRQVIRLLHLVNEGTKPAYRFIFNNLKEHNVSSKWWLPYGQGFYGWTLHNRDGISGNQTLFIRVMDSLLNLPTNEGKAFADKAGTEHVPDADWNFVSAIRAANLRQYADKYPELDAEIQEAVKQLRLWRMAHIPKARKYESAPAPERKMMTAGNSLITEVKFGTPTETISQMAQMFVARLQRRLEQTR